MSRPMNDDEVLNEMKKMVAFIKQEAMEKAREIQVKADEEFAIEKAKIVRQEAMQIDASFDKRRKQAEVSHKIAQSTSTNAARLRILEARQRHLQQLFDAAREGLAGLAKDKGKYEALLHRLSLQGLLQLIEPSVTLRVRSTDVQLVQGLVEKLQADYKSKTKHDVKLEVKEGLPKDSAGGVLLSAHNDRIKINNTLDERLRLLEDLMLPEIRMDLFGPNENRKFFT